MSVFFVYFGIGGSLDPWLTILSDSFVYSFLSVPNVIDDSINLRRIFCAYSLQMLIVSVNTPVENLTVFDFVVTAFFGPS